MKQAGSVLVVLVFLAVGCADRNPLEEMENLVPLPEGGAVTDKRHIEEHGETVIQYEIDASQMSEDDIIAFYTEAMGEKGWESEDIKRWPGNGSVFSMTEHDRGTLTVQTITKNVKETGKIRVVLNLKGM